MVEMAENAVNRVVNFQLPITLVGIGCLAWFCLAMGYTYPLLGNSNSRSVAGISNQIGITVGSAFLGCLALILGLILLSAQWANVQSTAYLVILITTISLGCTAAAMSVSGITH